jgi:hypothetical protein
MRDTFTFTLISNPLMRKAESPSTVNSQAPPQFYTDVPKLYTSIEGLRRSQLYAYWRICFIQGLSAYRAVNTLHFGYKNQSLNVLLGKSRCLF